MNTTTEPSQSPSAGPGVSKHARVIVHAVVFIAFLDTFALLPTVGPYAADVGATTLGVGLAVSAYSLSNMVFNVFGGVLMDRIGRRRILLGSLAASALAMAAYAAVTTPASLITVRLVHGAAAGMLVPAVFTVVADLSMYGSSGRAMGRVGAIIGSAAIVGPALAGILRDALGFTGVFLVVATLMLIGTLSIMASVPETAHLRPAWSRGFSMSDLLRLPGLQAAFIGVVTLTFAMGLLSAYLPIQVEALGWRPSATGALFTGFALVAAVMMLTGVAQTVDRRGLTLPAGTGILLLTTALAVLASSPSGVVTVAMMLIAGGGYGLIFPATAGQVTAAAGESRGKAFGLYNVFFSVGLASGPALGGLLTTLPGDPSPFLAGVVVCGAGAVALWWRARSAPLVSN